MGTLLDARVLAQLHIVINTKLRRREAFVFTPEPASFREPVTS